MDKYCRRHESAPSQFVELEIPSNGRILTDEMDAIEAIKSLQAKWAKAIGIPVTNQRWVLHGTILDCETCLKDCLPNDIVYTIDNPLRIKVQEQ